MEGKDIDERFVQFMNAPAAIVSSPSGKEMFPDNDLQSEKALYPIAFRLSGSIIEINDNFP